MRTPDPAVTCRMAWFSCRTWSGLVVAACLVGVAVLAASCGGSPSASGHHADHPSTTKAASQTAAVLAAYRAEWKAFEQAAATANAADPALVATMVNPLLDQVRRNLVSDHYSGIVGRGTFTLHPKVIDMTAATATVVDCAYSTAELVYAATGKPVPPVTPPEHDGVRATLMLVGPTWKVSKQSVTDGSCPPGS